MVGPQMAREVYKRGVARILERADSASMGVSIDLVEIGLVDGNKDGDEDEDEGAIGTTMMISMKVYIELRWKIRLWELEGTSTPALVAINKYGSIFILVLVAFECA